MRPQGSFSAVVVTIDGTRLRDITNWNARMVAWAESCGARVPNLVNLTRGITDPNHAILWGSADPGQCINWEGHPKDPLHPELLQEQWGLPSAGVVEISGKTHCLLGNTYSSHFGPTYACPTIIVNSEALCPDKQMYQGPDSLIVQSAVAYLQDHDVAWMGLNLSEYDFMTHAKGLECLGFDTTAYWEQAERIYREAERLVIDELWAYLQSDPRYRDRTVLAVTTDHGRHDDQILDGFLNHGHGWLPDSTGCAINCSGCRDMWALFAGAGIKDGYVATGSYTIDDIAPTVRAVLGFDNPFEIGAPIAEILSSDVTAVPPQAGGAVFRVGLSRPNPSLGSSTFDYSIAHACDAEITIVDVSGRLVASRTLRNLSAGTFTFTWDGLSQAGAPVGSGTYFYRLSVGDFSQARAMTLIR